MCCFLKNAWGWMVTFSTFLLIMPVTGILSSFGVIFVKLQAEYVISDFALGWIGSVAFGFMFVVSPLSTGLFKRFGHRKVAIVGVIFCSAGLLLSAAVPHPYYLFATYSVLFGVGSNFIDNTTLNLVGTYFPRKNSARASCFATLGWSVGSLALNPAIELLCERFGWRKTFIILGCCLFVHGLICAAFYSKRVDYVIVELPDEEDSENKEEYYNDDEIDGVEGLESSDVFKPPLNGYIPIVANVANGKVGDSVLATQLSTINESALSNENVNQNCHNPSSSITRKDYQNGESVGSVADCEALASSDNSRTASESSRRDSTGSKPRRSSSTRRDAPRTRRESSTARSEGSNGRRESVGRKDSTGKSRRSSVTRTGSMSRRDSFLSRRDSAISFIRRDSAWSRRDSTRSRKIPIPDNTPKHTTKQYVRAFLNTIKAPGILLWGLANILMNMSLIFPFINLIKYMETIGIPSAKGVHVLMVFGVCDLVGRGGSAIFGDYIPFHTVFVYPICNLIMGGVTMCLLVITTVPGLYGYAVVVGVLTGIVNSMLLKVTMDLFGHKLLAEAWTLTLLSAGIGITFGPSIAGASYDLTNSFDVAFYIGGSIYLLATIVTLLIPCVQRRHGWVPEKKLKPRLDSLAGIPGLEGLEGLEGYRTVLPSIPDEASSCSEGDIPKDSKKEPESETYVDQKLTVV